MMKKLKIFQIKVPQGVKNHAEHAMLDPTDPEKKLVKIDAQFTWNGYPGRYSFRMEY